MVTGGSSGEPENFSTWRTQDKSYVFGNIKQTCNLYLAVVHIWDKHFGFPFVPKKDPMPGKCMIHNLVDYGDEE